MPICRQPPWGAVLWGGTQGLWQHTATRRGKARSSPHSYGAEPLKCEVALHKESVASDTRWSPGCGSTLHCAGVSLAPPALALKGIGAVLSASSNCGRTLIRVLIFSLKILSLLMPSALYGRVTVGA